MTLAAEFESTFPFAFDDFQRRGCRALEEGRSVLVCAPTGAGKTVVGEFAVWTAIRTGRKAFYTTPLKALSNQKFGDFIAAHGASNVGLLTGDNSINGEAPVVVMTTEVLRNMLYEGSGTLAGLGYVVMDEVHYLRDPYRGAVWEEVLIHLPPDVRVAALSATVSNAEEFGDWLATVRGDTDVVIEDKRPVPLEHRYMIGDQLHPTFVARDGEAMPNPALARATAPVRRGRGTYQRRVPPRQRGIPSRVDVVERLDAEGLLPAITFIFSRNGCDQAVRQCVSAGLHLVDKEERERIVEYVELRAGVLADEDLEVLGYEMWREGLERGISSHHAGMIPLFKETVEELFERGLIKMVFATETLSLGINMPAKTVVIERLMKFTGEKHEMLTPSDYTQLTGRAGRRGIDPVGYGVVVHQPDIPFDRIAALAGARTYPLSSSFRPSYNMAVNLMRSYTVDDAIRLLNLSFAQFLADRSVVKLERTIEDNRRFLAGYREHLECDRGDVLEWYELLKNAREERRARTRDQRRERVAEMETTIESLRPGSVVRFDRGRNRGLAVVVRRIGNGLLLLGERGDRIQLNARNWRHPPRRVGALDLPEGHRRTPAYFGEVRKRLQTFRPPPDERTPVRAPAFGDYERRAEEHPVASCPDRAEHERWAERYERLREETETMDKRVGRRTGTLARTFGRVLEILQKMSYVDANGDVTEKGERLCRIYNESDLLVAEALESGMFAGLDAPESAALASTLVFDARGLPVEFAWPTERVRKAFGRLMRSYKSIHEIEQARGIDLCREPDPGFTEQIYWWAKDEPFDEVLPMGEMSAGDFVRSTKQVWDLLKQLAEVAPDDGAAKAFRSAADEIYRGVVAYAGAL
jgi:ATP-dependent RNA helicase HelY